MKKINELTENEVVNATTLEDSERLCKMAHELGLKWKWGSSYLIENNWLDYEEEMCYDFNLGSYGDMGFYKDRNFKIYDAKEFFDSNSEKPNDSINEQKKEYWGTIDNKSLINKTGYYEKCEVEQMLKTEQKTFFPEVGKEYEFSHYGNYWEKLKFYGFLGRRKNNIVSNTFKYIREIQPDQKELEAIEYLKNLGYKIER